MTKNKVIKIVAIALAAVILVGAGVCLLVPSIRNSFTKPGKLYEKAEGKWLTSKTETISNVFSKVSNVTSGDGSIGCNASLKLIMSDSFAQEAELNGIKDLELSTSISAKGDYSLTSLALSGNGTKAMTVNAITDSKNEKAYLQVPELSDGYVEMSSEDAQKILTQIEDSSSSLNGLKDKIDVDSVEKDVLAELGITDKEFEDTLNHYSDVFVKSTSKNVKKGSEKDDIDGKKYNYTTLTLSLSYKDLTDLGVDVLTEMKDDDVIAKIVEKANGTSKKDWQAQIDQIISSLDGAGSMSDALGDMDDDDNVDDILSKNKNKSTDFGDDEDDDEDDDNLNPKKTDKDDEIIKVVTYVDSSTQSVMGKKISMTADSNSVELGYLEIDNKKENALKVWATSDDKDVFTLEGSADKNKDKYTGKYELTVTDSKTDKESTVALELKDYEVVDKDKGLVSGDITLSVDADGQKDEITLNCSVKNKKQTIATTIKQDGKDYLTVETSYEETEVSDVKVPSSKDKIYKADDDTELSQYLQDADLETFKTTMTKAFGEEFVNDAMGKIDENLPDEGGDDVVTPPDTGDDDGDDSQFKYNGFSDMVYSFNGNEVKFPCSVAEAMKFTQMEFDDKTVHSGDISFGRATENGKTNYDFTFRIRNNTDADLASDKCTLERFTISSGDLAGTMNFSVNGVKVGDKVSVAEKAFGTKIGENTSIDIKDPDGDNTIILSTSEGVIDAIKLDYWEYEGKK